jgi:hypothetical protein
MARLTVELDDDAPVMRALASRRPHPLGDLEQAASARNAGASLAGRRLQLGHDSRAVPRSLEGASQGPYNGDVIRMTAT